MIVEFSLPTPKLRVEGLLSFELLKLEIFHPFDPYLQDAVQYTIGNGHGSHRSVLQSFLQLFFRFPQFYQYRTCVFPYFISSKRQPDGQFLSVAVCSHQLYSYSSDRSTRSNISEWNSISNHSLNVERSLVFGQIAESVHQSAS